MEANINKKKLTTFLRLFKTILQLYIWKLRFGKHLVVNRVAFIDKSTSLQPGKGFISLGNCVYIERGGYLSTQVGGRLVIDDRTFINRNCYLACRDQITIGKDCAFGPNVSIYDHDHKFSYSGVEKNNYKTSPVVIEDNCWLGDGVVVLKGSHIGEGSIIGAGAIITGFIPPHSLVKSGRDCLIIPIVDKP